MADDGMLLNFELPSGGVAPKTSFKGGNWKDRMIARKKSAWADEKARERIQTSRADYNATKHAETSEPPTKRLRTELSHAVQARQSNSQSRTSKQTPQSGIISSLFTYNPATEGERHEDLDNEAAVPSNAPITNGPDSFISLGVSEVIASHLVKKMNVSAPTEIQRKAIQQLCSKDQDAFIQAQTGSGKTLAYLLPIVQRISQISRNMKASGEDFGRKTGLLAIILAPTRELCKQIASVLETLLSCFPFIIPGSVTGGENKKSEKSRLRKGVNILVATPGRLSDHLNHTEVIDVSNVRWLVLDEGDRLMELGFEQDIQQLVGTLNLRATKAQETPIPGLPPKRMTILCSATIRDTVDKLQNLALKQAVTINVDQPANEASNDAFSAPAQLRQGYVMVPPKQRLVTLCAVLKQNFRRKGSVMKAIVFMSCADSVDFHFEVFTKRKHEDLVEELLPPRNGGNNGKKGSIPQGLTISDHRTSGKGSSFSTSDNEVEVFRLHGSLPQPVRTSTLKAFSATTKAAVLICTDVASRGLDLPNIELVIEADPAFSKEEHLHRIGRTARAGNDGRALIFLQPGCEEGYVQILKDTQPKSLKRHEADEFLKKAWAHSNAEKHWADLATEWQLYMERWIIENPLHTEQAIRAFQSHVRAYATHIAAERSMFDIKQLHLGHLAKAFCLREKPGSMKVPGMRPRAPSKPTKRRTHARDEKDADGDRDVDEEESKRKMQMKLKAMNTGASEFNLG